MDLRRELFTALTGDAALCALLPKGAGSVYMNLSTDASTVPALVCTVVDEVPAFADGAEVQLKYRFQVSIITADAEYDDIEAAVQRVVYALGATRAVSTEFIDGGHHFRVVQYRLIRDKE